MKAISNSPHLLPVGSHHQFTNCTCPVTAFTRHWNHSLSHNPVPYAHRDAHVNAHHQGGEAGFLSVTDPNSLSFLTVTR